MDKNEGRGGVSRMNPALPFFTTGVDQSVVHREAA